MLRMEAAGAALAVALLACMVGAGADGSDHRYKEGDSVPLYANKVGPFHNPSIWGHKIYTIYSILFIVFIILIIVTAFVTVALTYFQLAVEDHKWWWRSVLCGGSTGIFIFFYCIYYYHARSDMSGFMQTSFFFGYMTCVCYGFLLMLGTVGFRASLLFVRHIYRSIKCE